jgi:hypothetical protein
MFKIAIKNLSGFLICALLAIFVALPVYTHLFDLFSYLTVEEIKTQAIVECEKNRVIAVLYDGRCVRRAYSLAIGKALTKNHESVIELLPQDFLTQSECECVMTSAEEFHDNEALL